MDEFENKFENQTRVYALPPKKRGDGFRETCARIAGSMSMRSWWAVLWLVIGQGIQLVAHAVAENAFIWRSVLFCGAVGFLALMAIIVGMVVGRK